MFNLKLYIFSPAIFRASHKGEIDKLNQLIKAGANVNIGDHGGQTPHGGIIRRKKCRC